MPHPKFVWSFVAAFGLGLLFATSAHAQLSVSFADPDAFSSFGAGNAAEAFAPQNLKFDFKFDFNPVVAQSELISDFGRGAPLLAGFDQGQGLEEEPAVTPGGWSQFLPDDSLRIPEPATFGFLGVLVLFGLIALHRVRHKSAVLTV